MSGYLITFSALFVVLLAEQPSCNQKETAKGSVIVPLAVGNYWVYRDSVFTDGQLTLVSNDTDKIVSTERWNGKATFIFNEGKEWFESGDTIYQLGRQRTGTKFPSPVMMAVEKEGTFNFVFGGDVVMQKTIVKLPDCTVGNWNTTSCFKIYDSCEGYIIVGYGVGVLREKSSACFGEKNIYSTRTLIDMQVKQ